MMMAKMIFVGRMNANINRLTNRQLKKRYVLKLTVRLVKILTHQFDQALPPHKVLPHLHIQHIYLDFYHGYLVIPTLLPLMASPSISWQSVNSLHSVQQAVIWSSRYDMRHGKILAG